tara:strand:+ start:12313 stop:12798 length:486 start_codon:yes stop_codon:yes gene_type:complete
MYSAGIIPCIQNHILVGKETSNGLWSGFAGKSEISDISPLETAFREFDEETCGVFGPYVISCLRENTQRYLISYIKTVTPKGHIFHMYLFDFTSFVYSMRLIQEEFLIRRQREINTHCLEKNEITWIHIFNINKLIYRRPFWKDIRKIKQLVFNYFPHTIE